MIMLIATTGGPGYYLHQATRASDRMDPRVSKGQARHMGQHSNQETDRD